MLIGLPITLFVVGVFMWALNSAKCDDVGGIGSRARVKSTQRNRALETVNHLTGGHWMVRRKV